MIRQDRSPAKHLAIQAPQYAVCEKWNSNALESLSEIFVARVAPDQTMEFNIEGRCFDFRNFTRMLHFGNQAGQSLEAFGRHLRAAEAQRFRLQNQAQAVDLLNFLFTEIDDEFAAARNVDHQTVLLKVL